MRNAAASERLLTIPASKSWPSCASDPLFTRTMTALFLDDPVIDLIASFTFSVTSPGSQQMQAVAFFRCREMNSDGTPASMPRALRLLSAAR